MSFGTRNRAIVSRARQRFEPSVVLPEVDYLESRIIIGKRYNFLKHRDPVRFNENQLSRAGTYDRHRYPLGTTSFPELARMVRNIRNLVTAFVASQTQQLS